jgi:CheY-like chemotaxis protein
MPPASEPNESRGMASRVLPVRPGAAGCISDTLLSQCAVGVLYTLPTSRSQCLAIIPWMAGRPLLVWAASAGRTVTGRRLEEAGYVIDPAADAAEAIRRARRLRFDAIIVNVAAAEVGVQVCAPGRANVRAPRSNPHDFTNRLHLARPDPCSFLAARGNGHGLREHRGEFHLEAQRTTEIRAFLCVSENRARVLCDLAGRAVCHHGLPGARVSTSVTDNR